MAAGVGLVPEDRRQQGLVMDFSIERNIALASLGSVQRGWPDPARRRAALRERLGAPPAAEVRRGSTNPVWTLSGGNQQKAVLAKWLARKPTLLIVDEPTRGIDVGTKAEVHRLLSELAAQGVAVLMISSELPEVLGMADRIIVLFEGRVTREFTRAEADEDAIMRAATGSGRGGRMTRIAEAPEVASTDAPARTRSPSSSFRFRELGIVLALVIVVGATTLDNHLFLSATSLQQLLSGAAIIALARDRRDDRDRHAQRRPLDRVDARHLRLRRRRRSRAPSGRPDPGRLPRSRSASASPAGSSTARS